MTMIDETQYFFPSDTYYKDLTFAQSGTSFTAPATGWVILQRKAGAVYNGFDGEYLALTNTSCKNIAIGETFPISLVQDNTCMDARNLVTYIPVSKGDNFKINFNATGNTIYFGFVYAKGCENEAEDYQQS